MRAYCYASGLIEFGNKLPDGALPIAIGRAKPLRDFIEVQARHGYQSKVVDGRLTKICGTEHLLVPGVPEAEGGIAKVDALIAWCRWLNKCAPKGIVVL